MNVLDRTHRPPSVRSMVSTNSRASVGSRSRTRSRSKTGTERSSRPRNLLADASPVSGLAYLDNELADEPDYASSHASPTMDVGLFLPPAPPKSALSGDSGSSQALHEDDTVVVTENIAFREHAPALDNTSEARMLNDARHAALLNRINTQPPPSAFFQAPEPSPTFGANGRDSVLTQSSIATRFSTTSTSLYPPSTSTASGTDSPPSPQSLAPQVETLGVTTFDPDYDEEHHCDGDDVSYRLRLLVKNSYFLPPAHSKPSPSDFAPTLDSQKKTSPTFMDRFRGKSKSKHSNPMPSLDPRGPMLRTTSESITLSAFPARTARTPQRSAPATPTTLAPSPKSPDMTGRVVVVREQVHDLVGAAKQAEQEMKTRGVRRDQGSPKGKQAKFEDVIDPTDAVDLPPPSAKYPFAVQASALHGLGVQDSVGAALLADHLPPPTSPGMSSFDADDRTWRKALLHAAVGHSLDNTPDVSMSTSADLSSPLPSPNLVSSRVSPSASRAQTPSLKKALEKKIVSKPLIEVSQEFSAPLTPVYHQSTPRKAVHHVREQTLSVTSPSTSASRPSSFFPLRSETPSGPQTQLGPPPRRHILNPLYSLSQTELLSVDDLQSREPLTPGYLTADSSLHSPSPVLVDAQDTLRSLVMTPPPMSHLSMYSSFSVSPPQHASSARGDGKEGSTPDSVTSAETRYYDDDEHDDNELVHRRASTIISVTSEGQASLSEYSQPSPTISAFQDALTGDDYHSTVSSQNQPGLNQRRTSTPRASPAPRLSTVSPPPRVSSSLAPIGLQPRPRSPRQSITIPRRMPSRSRSQPDAKLQQSFLDLGDTSTSPADPAVEFMEPPPVTPPFPIAERRGNPATPPLTLTIPIGMSPMSIRSAPPPASPTSFFDDLQTQPNAMDDLDSSSSDEDDEEPVVQRHHRQGPPSLHVDPRTRTISTLSAHTVRPAMYRLGNHSTPYVSRSTEPRPTLPFGVSDRKKPIANIPPRAPFFGKRPNKSGQGLPASTFDFYQYTHSRPAEDTSPRRPGTADPPKNAQTNQRALQSTQELDGLLKRHMEAEKDVLKRIAMTSLRSSSSVRPSSVKSGSSAPIQS